MGLYITMEVLIAGSPNIVCKTLFVLAISVNISIDLKLSRLSSSVRNHLQDRSRLHLLWRGWLLSWTIIADEKENTKYDVKFIVQDRRILQLSSLMLC